MASSAENKKARHLRWSATSSYFQPSGRRVLDAGTPRLCWSLADDAHRSRLYEVQNVTRSLAHCNPYYLNPAQDGYRPRPGVRKRIGGKQGNTPYSIS
jgi:hypothetical protein